VALLVKNGMPKLSETLAALEQQTGCEPFEVSAVVSGSADGSLEALIRAKARVTKIDPASFRFGTARQMAFAQTQGKVIVTLSQDAVPGGRDWLAAMTAPILSGEADIVQAVEKAPGGSWERAAIYFVYTCPYRSLPRSYHLSCTGLAISRRAWEQTGFGDVPMCEDKYLAARAREKKLRVRFCSAVPLIHFHQSTLLTLAKRSFNEGLGARYTFGSYGLGTLLLDLTIRGPYRGMASGLLKHHDWRVLSRAWMFPVRPIFLYLGNAFGKRYWH
jgi:rhamnosyltransferase